MAYDSKIFQQVTVTDQFTIFLPKADINVKDVYYAVQAYSSSKYLVMNNNLTLNQTRVIGNSSAIGVYMLSSSEDEIPPSIFAGQAAKTLKVTLKAEKNDEISADGWSTWGSLNIIGGFMRHNFTVSSQNTSDGTNADAIAYGIFVAGKLNSEDTAYTGKFTITSKTACDAKAYAFSCSQFTAADLAGQYNITASGSTANAYGVFSGNVALEKLTGKFNINAQAVVNNNLAGSRSVVINTNAEAVAIYANGELTIDKGFTGTIKTSAKGNKATAYGLFSNGSSVTLGGKNSGSIALDVNGISDSYASSIYGTDVTIANFSGALSAKSVYNTNAVNGGAAAIFAKSGSFTAVGDFSGKITVSVQNKSKDDNYSGSAKGIHAASGVTMEDITGTWNIQGKGESVDAVGIYSDGEIDLDDISGKITVSSASSDATAFHTIQKTGDDGLSFSADRISGNITITGNGSYACGINSYGNVSINDMSKMKLKVTSKNGKAYGIDISASAGGDNDSTSENLMIGKCGLDMGSITVNGWNGATGITVNDNITLDANTLDKHLRGKISAAAAYANGIKANSFDKDLVISADISATGKCDAYGIRFDEGDLTLDGAKITAKTTSKNHEAYAIYTADSSSNNIDISGKTKLTGSICTGSPSSGSPDSDVVTIESGSQLNGGLEEVEKLTLKINDSSQKNTVMWNATKSFDSQCEFDCAIDDGLTGDFKLITKKSNMEWSDIIDSQSWISSNDLFAYHTYAKGNNLYLKATVREGLDTGVCYDEKLSSGEELTQDKVIFTDKANMTLKNSGFLYDPENDIVAAIDASATTTLILDNNITFNNTDDEDCDVYGVIGNNISIASANAAKTLKVTAKGDELYTIAGYRAENITLLGKRFLQNITVSNSSGSNEYAYGITSSGSVTAEGSTIAGKFTISGKTADGTSISVFGIDADSSFEAEDISGQFKITGNSDGSSAKVYGINAGTITLEKLSGKFDLSCNGSGYNCQGSALDATTTTSSITVNDGFSGKITVNVKNSSGKAEAYAFSSYTALTITGKNTGTISLNASGLKDATSCGLYGESSVKISNYSGAITAKAVSDLKEAEAMAIYSTGDVTIHGDFASKLTVSAQSKKETNYSIADAWGIMSGSTLEMDDISGVWNISAKGPEANAFGIQANDITVGDISGSKTISATANSSDHSSVTAGGFYSSDGKFTAEKVSGNITVTSSGTAYGFYCKDNFSVEDMSKMNLKVTGKNGTADGIYTESDLLVGNAGLDLGKIAVNAKGNAYGVNVSDYIYYDSYAGVLNNRLEGNITVRSQNESAYGICADAFARYENSAVVKNTEVICSTTVSVTGKKNAYGVYFKEGNLTFDGAKITTKVTGDGDKTAVVTMDKADNTITLTGKSKLVGDIFTGSYKSVSPDNDIVSLDNDIVSIESGSKLVGALVDVENLKLVINDSTQAKNSLWDAVEYDFDSYSMPEMKLWLDIDYGLTGDFLLATKKSDMEWDDVINFNSGIGLSIGDQELGMYYNYSSGYNLSCTYGDLSYELEQKGNKLFLSVTEVSQS